MPFLGFLDNFLQSGYGTFQKSVDNFQNVHKICPILVWGAVPLKL